MAKAATSGGLQPRQLLLLSILVLQTSGTTFLMHRSLQFRPQEQYAVSTAVFLGELTKFITSAVGAVWSEKRNRLQLQQYTEIGRRSIEIDSEKGISGKDLPTIREEEDDEFDDEKDEAQDYFISNNGTAWQQVRRKIFTSQECGMCLPAVLYVFQNLAQLYATKSISPLLYQSLSQLKVMTATVPSMLLMNKRYTSRQWSALTALLIGIATMTLSSKQGKMVASPSLTLPSTESAFLMGVLAVVLSCLLGSSAAVYIEMKVKGDQKFDLWVRNAQLSLYSLLPATAVVLQDYCTHGSWAPMRNFGMLAWATVLVRALSGFLVAMVLKYTDAIYKGIATSIAVVLTLCIEVSTFDRALTLPLFAGFLLTVSSSIAYANIPTSRS